MPNVTFIVYNESTPCDQKAFLYMLQQNLLPRDGVYKKNASHCSRPFHLRHIPYSNLVLVVVETLYPTCYRRLSVAPMEVYYNYSKYPCQKVQLNELPRRKRMGCFSDHPQEVDIKMCGDGNVVSLSLAALFLSSLVLTTVQVLGH